MELLNVATIACAGLMTGNEFAVAAFIHPALERLPDDAHLAGASAIARVLGRFMPFWYGFVLLLILADALGVKHAVGHWPVLIVVSAVLWAVSIAFTVTALVPINNRIAAWSEATHPADWKSYRHRWDGLHRRRVLLLAISFVLLIIGILRSLPSTHLIE